MGVFTDLWIHYTEVADEFYLQETFDWTAIIFGDISLSVCSYNEVFAGIKHDILFFTGHMCPNSTKTNCDSPIFQGFDESH